MLLINEVILNKYGTDVYHVEVQGYIYIYIYIYIIYIIYITYTHI